jgi:hypothetical protein
MLSEFYCFDDRSDITAQAQRVGRNRKNGEREALAFMQRHRTPHPRPTNGIFVAMTVTNWAFALGGRPAM